MEDLNEHKERIRREREAMPRLKRHKTRLSLADYLNESEPPLITRTLAIRLRCLDCCGNSHEEVRLCTAPKCPLWPFRMGAYQRPPQKEWETRRRWDPSWDKA